MVGVCFVVTFGKLWCVLYIWVLLNQKITHMKSKKVSPATIHARINVRSKVLANLLKMGFHPIAARKMMHGLVYGI